MLSNGNIVDRETVHTDKTFKWVYYEREQRNEPAAGVGHGVGEERTASDPGTKNTVLISWSILRDPSALSTQ